MKTLSKSPYGIYLLKKGDQYHKRFMELWYGECNLKTKINVVPLDQLTEEQAEPIAIKIGEHNYWAFENYGMNDWPDKKIIKGYINNLLRQNNEPELRQGERPEEQILGVQGLSIYEGIIGNQEEIDEWEQLTDPADILIEI